MYRSIVVGTDGSTSAREAVVRAIALARAGSGQGPGPASLHLVSAYQPLSGQQVERLRSAVPDHFRGDVTEDMAPRGALDEARTLLEGTGLTYTVHDPRGAAADSLLKVADEVEADLIVVGSSGLGRSHHRRGGSVPAALAGEAPVDLLIVRPADGGGEAETKTSALGRLGEMASRFETDHPELVKTISDVSYYLSGLGI